jgi:hypothetical protein
MLAAHLKCELCKGHCYVMRNGEHQRLDYKEMSYWAKQNVCSFPFFFSDRTHLRNVQVLGESDKYNPPNALSFDRCPKHSRPNTQSRSVTGPEIHVHLELQNALQFGGSVFGNRESVSSDIGSSHASESLPS